MGRDAHVGKDPENKKGESGHAPEPSSLLRETLDHELADSNDRKMEKTLEEGKKLLRELDRPHDFVPLPTFVSTPEVVHETAGSGFYKVGNDIGNGINIVKISIEEVKPEGYWMIQRTLVDLSNGAHLHLKQNHITNVIYPPSKPGVSRDLACTYDKDGMLEHVSFNQFDSGKRGMSSAVSIDIWERVGPNKWQKYSTSTVPGKIWHGRLEMDRSGELKLFNTKGELHTIYATDGKVKRIGGTRRLE
jgi:hypothetical protein